MNERIQKLLERELAKLEYRSQQQITEPLSPQDIKSLDVLIRAYRTFVSPPESSAVSPAADDPASQSTESLLDGLNNEQTK